MAHSLNFVVGSICGMLVAILGGAFLVQWLSVRTARFKPRYRTALLSVVVGYVAAAIFAAVVQYPGAVKDHATASLLTFVGLIGSMAVCHITFIKSESGSGISRGNALIIAAGQVFGAVALVLAVMLPIKLLAKIFHG